MVSPRTGIDLIIDYTCVLSCQAWCQRKMPPRQVGSRFLRFSVNRSLCRMHSLIQRDKVLDREGVRAMGRRGHDSTLTRVSISGKEGWPEQDVNPHLSGEYPIWGGGGG